MLQADKTFRSIEKAGNNIAFLYAGYLLVACFLVFRLALIFSYEPELGGIDNNFVYTVTRRLGGYLMYTDPTRFPFSITLYAPLYFDLCYLAGKIFRVNPDNAIAVYRLCRSVSFICDVTTLYLLYLALQKNILFSKGLSILSTGLFGAVLCYLGYTFSRSDSLFLTFYSAVFFILTSEQKLSHKRNIFLLALLCTACIFSKQNGIILPFLTGLWLLISTGKKQAAFFYLFFILIFSAVLFFYCSLYGTQNLMDNTIRALQNRIDPAWFYGFIFKPLSDSLLIIPLTIALVRSCQNLVYQREKNKALSVVYIFQLFFSLGTSLKSGSTLGYFNESLLLSFIIIGKEIYSDGGKALLKRFSIYLLTFTFIFMLYVYSQGYLFFLGRHQEKKNEYYRERTITKLLQSKAEGNYVLNLAEPNRTFFKNLLYKEMAVPNFDMVDCCTMPDKNFDYRELKDDLQNGTIRFLILPHNVLPEKLWGVPLFNYIKDTSFYQYDIYKYKNFNDR
jgi:hypothetical protein